MTKTIDYISVYDSFWIQFKNHFVSFGYKELPSGTHFTIAFDERNPDVNFHVTKNSKSQKDKPQIKIVVIDKLLLTVSTTQIILSILNKILVPLNIAELKAIYDCDLGFFSFDDFQNSEEFSFTEQQLVDNFKKVSKVKQKTRLKIEGDIEGCFENLVTSDKLQKSFLNNSIELSKEFGKDFQNGVIMTDEKTLPVIKLNEMFFTIKTDIKLFDILCGFVNPQLARLLIWKTKRALIAVKNATTYSDTELLNKPIRFVSNT